MPLKLYQRNAIWHYRGTIAGRRLRGSTRTADKDTARRIADEKAARQWKGELDGPGAVLTFAQAAILYRQANKSARFLERVEDYWKDTLVRDITPGTVRQAAIVLYPKASGATRNRQIIVPTQAVINHAAEMELCPPLRVRRFPVTKADKEPVTWEWIESFMAHSSPHLSALACFMFLTGARISEALALQWEEVDMERSRALIRQTKIGTERRAHLPQPLLVALANIPGQRVGRVFRYTSRSTAKFPWRAAIRMAGIKPLSFHACRHGFATAMLQAGVDPVTVAKLGGWKSAHHVFATYGHAAQDDTQADLIAGTNMTHASALREKTGG